MSVQALSCAFAVRGLSPSEKLVLLALSNYANERMQCWPSQERLAADTELSERTVWAALKSLEGLGVVVRTPRKRADGTRTTDVFTLHFALVVQSEPVANPAKSTRNPCESQSQDLRNPVATVATLTTFEPSVNRQEEPGAPVGAPAHAERERRSSGFDQFWEAYPRKVGKLDAQKAWKRAKLPPLADVLAALDRYVRSKPADIAFCNPSTWLNQGRWLDETAPPGTAPPAPVPVIDPAEQARRVALIERMSA